MSALAAIPAAFFSFGLADSAKTPNFVRYLIAPGYVLALHVCLKLAGFLWLALCTNAAYYTLLICLISSWMDAHANRRSLEDRYPTNS